MLIMATTTPTLPRHAGTRRSPYCTHPTPTRRDASFTLLDPPYPGRAKTRLSSGKVAASEHAVEKHFQHLNGGS